MHRHFLVIDGYNLMHVPSMIRQLNAPTSLERSRNEMIQFLAKHLSKQEKERTTIVFDAINATGIGASKNRISQMKIVFPAPGGDADTEIENIISRHTSPKQVLIVSGDKRLHRAVKKRKGRFIESAKFLNKLLYRGDLSIRQEVEIPNEKKFGSSLGDVSHWMAVFSDIDLEFSEDVQSELSPQTQSRSNQPHSKRKQDRAGQGEDGQDEAGKSNSPKVKSPRREPQDAKQEQELEAIMQTFEEDKATRNNLSPEEELKMWESRISELFDE